MSQQKFSVIKRIQSFKHAIAGCRTLWVEEHNVRIHILAMLLVFIAGFLLKVSLIEWCILVLTVVFVITVEALNSSLENLADAITEEYDGKIKKAKDIGAAAVLIAAIAAVVIGLLIFLPKVILLFN